MLHKTILFVLFNTVLLSAAADQPSLPAGLALVTKDLLFEGLPVLLRCAEKQERHISTSYHKTDFGSGLIAVFDKHGKSQDIANFVIEILLKSDKFTKSYDASIEVANMRDYILQLNGKSAGFAMAGIFKQEQTLYSLGTKTNIVSLFRTIFPTTIINESKISKPDSVLLDFCASKYATECHILCNVPYEQASSSSSSDALEKAPADTNAESSVISAPTETLQNSSNTD